jgi:hypothetical protein
MECFSISRKYGRPKHVSHSQAKHFPGKIIEIEASPMTLTRKAGKKKSLQ